MIKEILNQITPYLLEIIGIILGTISSYVILKLKKVYEEKINTETKKEIIKTVVEMVEQLAKSKGWDSKQKLQQAQDNALRLLNQKGINITQLELDILIEATCNSFIKNTK